MIKKEHKALSVRQQCGLLGLARSGYYYEPKAIDSYNLKLMELIDEQYTKTPYYGSPKLTACLQMQGYRVNIKRVKRLMRLLGISAIYTKPKTSIKGVGQYIYPYLLSGLEISRANQVWCADITYIRVVGGFMYLVAIMDWHSRYILSWELSNTLDSWFCIAALNAALAYAKPEIFNTDQGVQFTSEGFTTVLNKKGIKISMDGKGRCTDNIMIERLWRSLKYEDIYLKRYETVEELYDGLTRYFQAYNNERPHQALGYKTPFELYEKSKQAKEVILC